MSPIPDKGNPAYWASVVCCLRQQERGLVDALAGYWHVSNGYIIEQVFALTALANGIVPGTALYDTFVAYYGLTPGTIPIDPTGYLSVYFMDATLWGALYQVRAEGGLSCSQKCAILRYNSPVFG